MLASQTGGMMMLVASVGVWFRHYGPTSHYRFTTFLSRSVSCWSRWMVLDFMFRSCRCHEGVPVGVVIRRLLKHSGAWVR